MYIYIYIYFFFLYTRTWTLLVIWEYWVMWTRNSQLPSMFTFHLFMSHLFQMTHTFSVLNSLYMYYSTSSLSIFLKEIKKIKNSKKNFNEKNSLYMYFERLVLLMLFTIASQTQQSTILLWSPQLKAA